MNSIERMQAALQCKLPDRVPIAEVVIDERIARAIDPGIIDSQDLMDRLDLDCVCCGASFKRTQEHDDGTFTDEWGVVYKVNSLEALHHPLKGPVATMDDARTYTPPDPEASHRLEKLEDVVSRYKGKRAIMFAHRAEFMWAAYLMGMDNLLASLLADPDLAELIMDKVLEANMRIVQRAIRAGAEIVLIGDDYAHNGGPMMSPMVFEKYLLPRFTRMVRMIKDEGAFCVKHSDGNIYPILDMLVSAGIDAINPIEPAAGMDLKTVKRLVGDRVCLMGNIDCSELLSHGDPSDVEKAVIEAISDAGANGGFILSSSNSIHSSVRPANYVAMIEAGKRHGGRPLRW